MRGKPHLRSGAARRAAEPAVLGAAACQDGLLHALLSFTTLVSPEHPRPPTTSGDLTRRASNRRRTLSAYRNPVHDLTPTRNGATTALLPWRHTGTYR
jgi:hypothetical protein